MPKLNPDGDRSGDGTLISEIGDKICKMPHPVQLSFLLLVVYKIEVWILILQMVAGQN